MRVALQAALGACVGLGVFMPWPAWAVGGPATQGVCEASPTSRWSGGQTGYRRDGDFGRAADAWLQAATGVVGVGGGGVMLVHDGVEGAVHELTGGLRRERAFGKRGGGPGEFMPLTPMFVMDEDFLHQYVAAGESTVFVFDGRISEFTRGGEFVGIRADLRRYGPGPIYGVRALHAYGDRLYFAVDVLTSNQRHLETYELVGDEAVLQHRLRLPMPPVVQGRVRTVGQEARPVWAASGPCIVLGDGSSGWLHRMNLATGEADTLRLPRHEVQLRSPTDIPPPLRDRWGGAAPDPTAVWRWRRAVIDPDGHVWLEPWRERAATDRSAYRIDPAGRVHRETLPAFPHAFGVPGTFYTRERIRSTDEVVIARFTTAR